MNPIFLNPEERIMNQRTLKAAFLNTIPVMTGYLFLGIGFGIIYNTSSVPNYMLIFLYTISKAFKCS